MMFKHGELCNDKGKVKDIIVKADVNGFKESKNDKEYEDRLDELELRISKLERLVRNNRYLLNLLSGRKKNEV